MGDSVPGGASSKLGHLLPSLRRTSEKQNKGQHLVLMPAPYFFSQNFDRSPISYEHQDRSRYLAASQVLCLTCKFGSRYRKIAIVYALERFVVDFYPFQRLLFGVRFVYFGVLTQTAGPFRVVNHSQVSYFTTCQNAVYLAPVEL